MGQIGDRQPLLLPSQDIGRLPLSSSCPIAGETETAVPPA
jgi:hypothetical protein